MPTRPGFTIPNFSDLPSGYSDQAEPDSGDFLVLGNHRNGVLAGCEFTFDGETLALTSADNWVVVGGQAVEVPLPASVTITPSGGPKFFLVVHTGTGLTALDGGAPDGENAVFPDITGDVAVLAAIYVPEAGAALAVDKRLLLAQTLNGWADDTSGDFVSLKSSTGRLVSVDATGKVYWGDEGIASIESVGNILNLSTNVEVENGLQVGGTVHADEAEFDGTVTGSNLRRGTGEPDDGDPGDLYQRADGSNSGLYFHTGSGWVEFMPPAPPPGTIITHVAAPSSDYGTSLLANGWLAFGTTVANANTEHPTLWSMVPSAWKSGTSLVLPDLSGRTLVGGTTGALTGDDQVTIGVQNLPSHKHYTGTTALETGAAGSHAHSGSSLAAAPDHRHTGVDGYTGGGFVFTDLNGDSKLFSFVENALTTASVSFGEVGINGKTYPAGGHNHALTIKSEADHKHTVPSDNYVGGGQPLQVSPLAMGVHHYIKA